MSNGEKTLDQIESEEKALSIGAALFIYFILGYGTAFVLDVMVNAVEGWEIAAAAIFWPLFWIKYIGWGILLLLQGLVTGLF